MNEKTEQNEVVTDLDSSFFTAYAAKMAAENKKSSSSSFTPREYEEVAYAGLESGTNKVLRLIGAPPGSESMGYKRQNYDPKQIMMCEVKDDQGKRFNIRLPPREESAAANHILHRLYDKVAEVAWINKKKVFVNETKHPELWHALTKGGFTEADGFAYSITSGYKPYTLTIMNVIDRSDNWCAENKHTKILCRDVSVDAKGNVWAKPGVKSFGFIKQLSTIIGKYGNYENYDISIKRTGEPLNPFEIKNASLYKEKDLLEELKNNDGTLPEADSIQIGPLTAEEKAYERYDLDKLFKPTSYTKILNRIPSLFKLCDATLGTNFFEELNSLSEIEKKEWEEIYGKEEKTQEAEEQKVISEALKEETDEKPTEAPPKRRTASTSSTGLSQEKISKLKGWDKLTDFQKELILDIKESDGKVTEIVWKDCDETKQLYACECDLGSPEIFESCPGCAASFV